MTTIKTICLLTGCEGTVAASDPAVVAEAGEAMKASTSRPAGVQTTAGALVPGQRAWVYDGESRSWWPCEVAALLDNAPTGAHVRGRNGGLFRGQSCPLSTEAAMSNPLAPFIEEVERSRETERAFDLVAGRLADLIAEVEAHNHDSVDEGAKRHLGALIGTLRAVRADAADERSRWSEWHVGACEALLSECSRLDALATEAA